jgi:hypothetical protein
MASGSRVRSRPKIIVLALTATSVLAAVALTNLQVSQAAEGDVEGVPAVRTAAFSVAIENADSVSGSTS